MTIESVLHAHFSRYPAISIQDAYKLVHQAALGSEHAVSSAEDARKWMAHELAEMGAGPDEPASEYESLYRPAYRVVWRKLIS